VRSNVELQSLGKDRFASAELHGKIVNICGDIPATALSDTATFKMLTGEDAITAQFKHRDLFTFVNTATLLFSANTLPETPDKSKGFYSRLLIVPFDKLSLDDVEVDSSIEPRMWAELEGVLVRAVEGLRRAMERGGFASPKACLNALARYIDHGDTVETFLENAVVAVEGAEIPRADFYSSYREYCRLNRLEPVKSSDFYVRVENSAALEVLPKKNPSGTRLFAGISIKPFVFF
jgi:putative DNA primase/helicase